MESRTTTFVANGHRKVLPPGRPAEAVFQIPDKLHFNQA